MTARIHGRLVAPVGRGAPPGGRVGSDPFAIDLTDRDMVQAEFCIDSAASASAGASMQTSYRIAPRGNSTDAPPIPLEPLQFQAFPSSLTNRHVTTEVDVSMTVLADGTVDLSSIEVSGGASSDVAAAVRAAVGRLKFQPARRNGKNVSEPMKIVLGFSSS